MPSRESEESSHITHKVAAVAHSVERRHGKAEVGGSIPLGSLFEKSVFTDFFVFSRKKGERNLLRVGSSC